MPPTRRDLLTTLGAVTAGNALLTDAVARDRNPAEQVADRASAIRITNTRATWVGPRVGAVHGGENAPHAGPADGSRSGAAAGRLKLLH